jgi:hypothetical protein
MKKWRFATILPYSPNLHGPHGPNNHYLLDNFYNRGEYLNGAYHDRLNNCHGNNLVFDVVSAFRIGPYVCATQGAVTTLQRRFRKRRTTV